MNKGIIYRLKNGNNKPNSWGLKQLEVGINVPGEGFKFINYFPGSDSIFVDAKTNKDRKVGKVTFEYNGYDATELVVPVENILLNKYLKAHPWFNVHFEIFSEEENAEKQLASFELKEKALMLVKESDDIASQAIAMAINGIQSYGWTALKAKAWLKEKAFTEPELIVSKMEAHNYESKYLSAMSFFSGIIKENNQKDRVVWNDENEGMIIPLAKGENGIDKLGEFLAESTDESRLVIQEVSKRINDLKRNVYVKANKVAATIDVATKEIIDSKDAKIAELKAALLKKEAKALKVEEEVEEEPSTSENEKIAPTLDELRAAYLEKHKKDVPPRFKNDEEWIAKNI
jgi:hypothetical protein